MGDVAARAGVKVSDAEMALQALAADSQGTLEVSPLLCGAEQGSSTPRRRTFGIVGLGAESRQLERRLQ